MLGFALWFPIAGHQVLRKVILPLALPDIVNSLRLIFGLAFGYIMLAEVINAKTGIGALIINSQRRGFAGTHLPLPVHHHPARLGHRPLDHAAAAPAFPPHQTWRKLN